MLQSRRWASAYYLYGLSVELAIKAIIAKSIRAQVIPPKGFSNSFYIHDIEKLVVLAGLDDDLKARLSDPGFKTTWEIVGSWIVDSRYENVDESRARAIASAVDDRKIGVFQWLKSYW